VRYSSIQLLPGGLEPPGFAGAVQAARRSLIEHGVFVLDLDPGPVDQLHRCLSLSAERENASSASYRLLVAVGRSIISSFALAQDRTDAEHTLRVVSRVALTLLEPWPLLREGVSVLSTLFVTPPSVLPPCPGLLTFTFAPAVQGARLEVQTAGAWQPLQLGSNRVAVSVGGLLHYLGSGVAYARMSGRRVVGSAGLAVLQLSLRGVPTGLAVPLIPPRDAGAVRTVADFEVAVKPRLLKIAEHLAKQMPAVEKPLAVMPAAAEASASESEFRFEFDADGYGDEADRAQLDAMTVLEREKILYERCEARMKAEREWSLRQKARRQSEPAPGRAAPPSAYKPRAVPTGNLSAGQRSAARTIVATLRVATDSAGRAMGGPFNHTPSIKKCPAYWKAVSNPIDLASIAGHLRAPRTYRSPWDFAFAVELLFTNTQAFYPKGSTEYADAEELRSRFHVLYQASACCDACLRLTPGRNPPTGRLRGDRASAGCARFAAGRLGRVPSRPSVP